MPLHVFQRHGVQQEDPLDGHQAQFPRPAGQGRLGGDHPVGTGAAGDEVGGDLPGGQSINQIQMDKDPLARLPHPLRRVPDGQDIAVEEKQHGDVALQRLRQPFLVLNRRNDRPGGQKLQKLRCFHVPLLPM